MITAVVIEYPRYHCRITPPTKANGADSMMRALSDTERKAATSRMNMMVNVIGTTTPSVDRASSAY